MNILISMPEISKIKQYGSSIGIALSRPILKNVFSLVVGSEVEIDYSKPPEIIIRPVTKKENTKGESNDKK
jgi:antitoxin component of MazEF toxin-antitoxin module